MELFFAENFEPGQDEIVLSPDESHHALRVLRKHAGEAIDLTDGRGHHIRGILFDENARKLTIRVESYDFVPFPAVDRIEVGLAIIRPNRMDWAVEKLTELGVERIVPVICHHNAVRTVKPQHLNKIAVSAIKQSNRFYLPQISPPMQFKDWLEQTGSNAGNKFVAHLQEKNAGFSQQTGKIEFPVFLAIGPEGGFHPDEIALAEKLGFITVEMGESILRTETAAVAAVAGIKLLR